MYIVAFIAVLAFVAGQLFQRFIIGPTVVEQKIEVPDYLKNAIFASLRRTNDFVEKMAREKGL